MEGHELDGDFGVLLDPLVKWIQRAAMDALLASAVTASGTVKLENATKPDEGFK